MASLISRRKILKSAGYGAAASLLLPMLPARAATPMATAMGWVPNVEFAGQWLAVENGYFADEGIDFTYLPGGPNAPDPLATLSAGGCQIAGSEWLPFLEAVSKGNDFVIIGSVFPTNPLAVLSLAARPVKEAKDLVGARVLGQSPTNKLMVDAMLQGAGLPLDYELIQTGYSPEPLVAGDGDAYLCYSTNQPITLERMGMKEGVDFFVTSFDHLGYRTPGGMIITTRRLLDSHPDAVVGYLRALAKGWTVNASDPSVAAKLAVEKFGVDLGLDLDQQIRQNELQAPLTIKAGGKGIMWFDPALVESDMVAIAKAAGQAEVPPTATIVDLGPLETALASL